MLRCLTLVLILHGMCFIFQTAMHWACKRGDENLVKLLAGVARQVINERSVSTLPCIY